MAIPTTAIRTVFDLGGKIHVSSPTLLDRKLNMQPGDLSKFASYKSIFLQEPCGGVIYFGNDDTEADFNALMRIMKVQSKYFDFAVFTAESQQPGKDGYLAQMRVISKFGLRFLFNALTDAEYEKFPKQKLTIVEALWLFIEHERNRWGTNFWQDGEKGLQGLFGGDGNYAREELAFGFTVENAAYEIYRIWSRAWLVHK